LKVEHFFASVTGVPNHSAVRDRARFFCLISLFLTMAAHFLSWSPAPVPKKQGTRATKIKSAPRKYKGTNNQKPAGHYFVCSSSSPESRPPPPCMPQFPPDLPLNFHSRSFPPLEEPFYPRRCCVGSQGQLSSANKSPSSRLRTIQRED